MSPITLTQGAPGWPARLEDLPDPPVALWIRGAIPDGPAVAIVGARGADAAGRRRCRVIAAGLARAGLTIVSGGARGIDGAAHEGALEGGGATIVVLAGGIDVDYPTEHQALFATIEQGRGAIVSEANPGAPPFRGAFLRRNRLIAALGDACVVVQADERSGSLSTARIARKLGRPILAVPWPADRPLAGGVRLLLEAGARPVSTAGDVLRALGRPSPPEAAATDDPPRLSGLRGRIWRLLGERDLDVDEIAALTGAKTQEICRTLLTLELQRLVIRSLSGRYGRNR